MNQPERTQLTVREQFAMAAMQGLLSNPGGPIQAGGTTGWHLVNCTVAQMAIFCVEFGDEVIKKASGVSDE